MTPGGLTRAWGAPLSDPRDEVAAKHKKLALDFADAHITGACDARKNASAIKDIHPCTILSFEEMLRALLAFKLSILKEDYGLFEKAVKRFKEVSHKQLDFHAENDVVLCDLRGVDVAKKGTDLEKKLIMEQLQRQFLGIEILDKHYGDIIKIHSEMDKLLG